jgi:hypothetical protein
MRKDTNQTAMQELLQHFIDAWSSPGDCWNPRKVIDKIESMIEKEKVQIINAYNSKVNEHLFAPITSINKINGEEYYNQTYKI